MSIINNYIDLLQSEVDKGIYVWGGDGENLSAMADPISWIKKHETSTQNANRALALYKKRLSLGVNPIRAFDCSGLQYWCLKQLGIVQKDINSRGLYGICTPIKRSELRAGDLAFRWSDKDGDGFDISEIYHVGAMIDSTRLIECQGRDSGVVISKVSSKWGAFGRITALNAADIDTATEFYRSLKKGDKGEDVRHLQALLMKRGYDLGRYGADGDFGSKTQQAVTAFQKAELLTYGIANDLTIFALGGKWTEE